MTYAPASLLALRSYLMPRTHLSAGNLGIVGDAAHAARATYHNGWDRFFRSGKDTCAENYTICTPRDRALPHTNAAMALDIGNHPGLRALSVNLVAQARRNAPGTSDMREIIYSPDGIRVLRWDRQRGFSSLPRTGEADSSHLWHTHISWYRASEPASKLAPFRAYYEPNTVPAYSAKITGKTMTYRADCSEIEDISGLTVLVAKRVSCAGHWRYRITSGKYAGRYLPATGTVTYTPL